MRLVLCVSFLFIHHIKPMQEVVDEDLDHRTIVKEYFDLAESFFNEKKFEKAEDYYQKALAIDADHLPSLTQLATIYSQQRNVKTAIDYYSRAIAIDKTDAQLHHHLGVCYYHCKQFQRAQECFKTAIEYNPNHLKAYFGVGLVYERFKHYNQAKEYFERALQLEPNYFDASVHLGDTYYHLDQLEKAEQQYRYSLSLNPNHINVLLGLANTLNMLNKTDEALRLYLRVLEIEPHLDTALYNFAYTLKRREEYEESIRVYKKVIERCPDYAKAHFGLALSHLCVGNYKEGWEQYEWRWKAYQEEPPTFNAPLWDGSHLYGKTILVYAEQGLGDTFQFVRYLQLIKEQKAHVLFQTQTPLYDILQLCPYIDEVFKRDEALPEFDYYIPLLSLPKLFRTEVNTIPTAIPYLYADDKLVHYWQQKLAPDTNFKIGLCWQCNTNYRIQSLRHIVENRHIPLKQLSLLADIPGVSFYSLQKDDVFNEIENNPFIKTFGPELDVINGRFMDTAAIIKHMDLVISIDTSVAHLAAGMGIPTWIVLQKPLEWRWTLALPENKSRWYPDAQLFMQQKAGDWDSVIAQVHKALQEKVKKYNAPQKRSRLLIDTNYSHLVADIPQLKPLLKKLHETNAQLQKINEELHTKNLTTFDKEYIDLARKACYADDVKMYLEQKIQHCINEHRNEQQGE